jgi:hypothetical protein
MEMDLAYIIVIILLCIALLALTMHMIKTCSTPTNGPTNSPSNGPIGGCAGTRYGCCPNSQIPKLNALGTNC